MATAERFNATALKRLTATSLSSSSALANNGSPQSSNLLGGEFFASDVPLARSASSEQDELDPKLVRTKRRSFFSVSENRRSAALFFGMTLIALIFLFCRETPMYTARIPPPHARPHKRRHRKYDQSPMLQPRNHTANTIQQRQYNQGSVSCESMFQKVQQHDIQLVAMDFDKTIVDLHTRGRWKRGMRQLLPHVRPSFVCLIRRCLEERNIPVAVTTFSRQTQLIADVLELALQLYQRKHSKHNNAIEITRTMIPVFGGDIWVEGYTKGKQSQLYLALKHVNTQDPAFTEITPSETLLIDDDPENIRVAVKDGYHTILYPAKRVGRNPQKQDDDDDDDDDDERPEEEKT